MACFPGPENENPLFMSHMYAIRHNCSFFSRPSGGSVGAIIFHSSSETD